MQKKYMLASGALIALLAATPAFADSDRGFRGGDENSNKGERNGLFIRLFNDRDNDRRDRDDDKDDKDRTTISGTVTAISGSTITLSGKNGATFTVDAANAELKGHADALADIAVGDTLKVKGNLTGSVLVAERIDEKKHMRGGFFGRIGDFTAGIVTAIGGSTFVIDPVGSKSTSTVTTNASTTIRVNGTATSSNAIAVGSKVLVVGTTTAEDTDNPLISASFVQIVTKEWNKLKHFLFR